MEGSKIGNTYLRKKPFQLYPKIFWFTIGIRVNYYSAWRVYVTIEPEILDSKEINLSNYF